MSYGGIMGLDEMFKLKADGKCPFCGKDMSNAVFKDKVSIKEFELTGLCQDCQDDFFGELEDTAEDCTGDVVL